MPHSIWALVMPTAPAKWYIESKKSLRDAASTGLAPPRGHTETFWRPIASKRCHG